MTDIFISYRRDDSTSTSTALYHALVEKFPSLDIFMDLPSIRAGDEFAQSISKSIEQAKVLLAMIGPNWLRAASHTGRRRLDYEDDFVRREIAQALEKNLKVIPVLILGAKEPNAAELPAPLKKLSGHNAIKAPFKHRKNASDFEELYVSIESQFALSRAETPPPHAITEANPVATSANSASSVTPKDVGEAAAQAMVDAGVDASTMLSVADARMEACDYHIEEAIRKSVAPLLRRESEDYGGLILQNRFQIARSCMDQGIIEEARERYDAILKEHSDPNCEEIPWILAARQNMAALFHNAGNPVAAGALLEQSVKDHQFHYEKNHAETLFARHALAVNRMARRQMRAAETDLKRLYFDWCKVYSSEDVAAKNIQRSIGFALMEQGADPDEARKYLPADNGAPDPHNQFCHAVLSAMIADADGDGDRADEHLKEAELSIAKFDPDHGLFRDLAKYHETRTPGQPGGTVQWMMDAWEKP